MISTKSVEEVIQRSSIEEVIGDYVQLRRRGTNLVGLCPFHLEKTPSFSVSPGKGIYKCFGCARSGNAVQFMMEHESMTFPEAIRYLAKKFSITIEETVQTEEVRQENLLKESLFIVNDWAAKYFQQELWQTEEGQAVGLPYFKERGFIDQTIKKFQLGYAPRQAAFIEFAIKHHLNPEYLRTLGLATEKNHDFFRERVIFPIQSLSGKILGFGGRVLKNVPNAPKYLNSPESEIYNKRSILFGLFQAKKAIKEQDHCLLVEGYTDVISLSQAGVENVVASSGTSLTVEQIYLIKRFTSNVHLLYDGDPAGINAAIRGLNLLLEKDLNVKIIILPEKEDPDSFIRKQGKQYFLDYLQKHQEDFIQFKLNQAGLNQDPIKKAEYIKDIVETVALVPDSLKRAIYTKEVCQKLGIREEIFTHEVNKNLRKVLVQQQHSGTLPQNDLAALKTVDDSESKSIIHNQTALLTPNDEPQEKDIIRILIQFGSELPDPQDTTTDLAKVMLENLSDVIEYFDNALYKKIILDLQQRIEQRKPYDPSYFLHHHDPEIQKLAIDLNSTPYTYSENWAARWEIYLQTQKDPEKNFMRDSYQSMMRFKLRKINRLIQENLKNMENARDNNLAEEEMLYLRVHQHYTKVRNEIAANVRTVLI